MELQEVISTLTEGLDPAEAAVVKKAIERDAVKSKASSWKAQSEFDAVAQKAARVAELEEALDGVDQQGNPKGFRKWYEKYKDAIAANDAAVQKFEAKYGKGSLGKAIDGQLPGVDPAAATGLTSEDVKREAAKYFQENLAPSIATVLKNTSMIVQRHMLAGRKTPVDMEALDRLMGEKKLTIDQAYEEWDKPEREKDSEAAFKKRVDDGVKAELQKRGSREFFSGSSEPEPPGILSRKVGTDKFDRAAMEADLLRAASTGQYSPSGD